MINPFDKYGQTEDDNRMLEGLGLLLFVGVILFLLMCVSKTDFTGDIDDAFRGGGQSSYYFK